MPLDNPQTVYIFPDAFDFLQPNIVKNVSDSVILNSTELINFNNYRGTILICYIGKSSITLNEIKNLEELSKPENLRNRTIICQPSLSTRYLTSKLTNAPNIKLSKCRILMDKFGTHINPDTDLEFWINSKQYYIDMLKSKNNNYLPPTAVFYNNRIQNNRRNAQNILSSMEIEPSLSGYDTLNLKMGFASRGFGQQKYIIRGNNPNREKALKIIHDSISLPTTYILQPFFGLNYKPVVDGLFTEFRYFYVNGVLLDVIATENSTTGLTGYLNFSDFGTKPHLKMYLDQGKDLSKKIYNWIIKKKGKVPKILRIDFVLIDNVTSRGSRQLFFAEIETTPSSGTVLPFKDKFLQALYSVIPQISLPARISKTAQIARFPNINNRINSYTNGNTKGFTNIMDPQLLPNTNNTQYRADFVDITFKRWLNHRTSWLVPSNKSYIELLFGNLAITLFMMSVQYIGKKDNIHIISIRNQGLQNDGRVINVMDNTHKTPSQIYHSYSISERVGKGFNYFKKGKEISHPKSHTITHNKNKEITMDQFKEGVFTLTYHDLQAKLHEIINKVAKEVVDNLGNKPKTLYNIYMSILDVIGLSGPAKTKYWNSGNPGNNGIFQYLATYALKNAQLFPFSGNCTVATMLRIALFEKLTVSKHRWALNYKIYFRTDKKRSIIYDEVCHHAALLKNLTGEDAKRSGNYTATISTTYHNATQYLKTMNTSTLNWGKTYVNMYDVLTTNSIFRAKKRATRDGDSAAFESISRLENLITNYIETYSSNPGVSLNVIKHVKQSRNRLGNVTSTRFKNLKQSHTLNQAITNWSAVYSNILTNGVTENKIKNLNMKLNYIKSLSTPSNPSLLNAIRVTNELKRMIPSNININT